MKQPSLAHAEAVTPSGSSIKKRFSFRKLILLFVRLLHPEVFPPFIFGVFAGGIIAAGYGIFDQEAVRQLIIASISAAFLAGAASCLKDGTRDAEGKFEGYDPRFGRWMWVSLSVSGGLLSLMLSPWHVGITLVCTVIVYAYHVVLKRVVWVRDVLVALFFPVIALVYGGRAVGTVHSISTAALFAFMILLTREIVSHDYEENREGAVHSDTVIAMNPKHTYFLSSTLILLVVILSPIPFLLLNYSGLYLLTILIGDGFLLRACFLLHVHHIDPDRRLVRSNLIASLSLGLLAFTLNGLLESMPRFY